MLASACTLPGLASCWHCCFLMLYAAALASCLQHSSLFAVATAQLAALGVACFTGQSLLHSLMQKDAWFASAVGVDSVQPVATVSWLHSTVLISSVMISMQVALLMICNWRICVLCS